MVAEGKGTRARIGMMKAPGWFQSDHPSEGRLRNYPRTTLDDRAALLPQEGSLTFSA